MLSLKKTTNFRLICLLYKTSGVVGRKILDRMKILNDNLCLWEQTGDGSRLHKGECCVTQRLKPMPELFLAKVK